MTVLPLPFSYGRCVFSAPLRQHVPAPRLRQTGRRRTWGCGPRLLPSPSPSPSPSLPLSPPSLTPTFSLPVAYAMVCLVQRRSLCLCDSVRLLSLSLRLSDTHTQQGLLVCYVLCAVLSNLASIVFLPSYSLGLGLACVRERVCVCPRLHYRLLTLCPTPTDPVGQSWPRGTGSVGRGARIHPACMP